MDKIFKKLNLKKIIRKYLNAVIYILITIIFCLVGYFTYLNVYLTSISPKPLNPNEIIAKKQKVNLILFKKITNSIANKKTPTIINNLANPWQ